MDTLSPEERSERMSRVKARDTKPELVIRRLVYSMGYRYRLHGKLPGKPDLVFGQKRKVIFIHGCYWHRHEGCPNCRLPKSKLEFWVPKLEGNKQRDLMNQNKLREMGWRFIIIWECELKDMKTGARRIKEFLEV